MNLKENNKLKKENEQLKLTIELYRFFLKKLGKEYIIEFCLSSSEYFDVKTKFDASKNAEPSGEVNNTNKNEK